MRPTSPPELQPYEERALRHLERLASAGVVPARALTTGPEAESNAFRVSEEQYAGLRQGHVVTVRATARLGRVRWIVRESGATRLGAP